MRNTTILQVSGTLVLDALCLVLPCFEKYIILIKLIVIILFVCSFTTETMSSWMRDANMDASIQSYAKSSVLRRDEYFFRIWYYAQKLLKE